MSDYEIIGTILTVIGLLINTVTICYMVFKDDNKK